ncbi:cytochrome c oxidase accessory protein CcoG [Brevifollis gellanilyticus]|uniref:Cytochrome c oxidase accessory protein CcoG n=1 Tax=Brevifollis gellanilyticus TaxID=748831 RepID=A0A512M9G5_9BACT|nr:cytochrome c oxidase accessory protein CcoG [Brevifollis gellanilyticus]GEP43375.1 cytochrome c oxidase accessory protein CcoG [Brevifollis gellanilyticus]
MPVNRPNLVTLGSIHEDGRKKTLHPADVSGKFTRARRLVALLLMVIYVALPWIPVNGYPAVFLDVLNRRFHFMGLTLAVQDLWVGFFLVTGLGFGLFYVTAFFGRVWCGWTCPYTVFLEHVYRRIERMIDGDAAARRRLDAAPWGVGKITRRVVKHALYVIVSLIVAHVFLSYFVSLRGLYDMMQESPQKHAVAFGVMTVITAGFYGAFSWFREQFCVILCPYGRIQSALSDDHTVTIGYDKKRGEPRGKVDMKGAGDCVNCLRCVQVCPTGIDIRNGLQMECIGCAACVDACDDIMLKLGRKPGLVRYSSFVAFMGGKTRFVRGRTILYTALLLLGLGVFGYAANRIEPLRANVLRMQGSPYYVNAGVLRNQFLVRLINKRNEARTFTLAMEGDLPAGLAAAGADAPITISALGEELKPLMITLPQTGFTKPFMISLRVTDTADAKSYVTKPFEYTGPDPRLNSDAYLDARQYLQQ